MKKTRHQVDQTNTHYDHQTIEPKWQKKWAEERIYFVDTESKFKVQSSKFKSNESFNPPAGGLQDRSAMHLNKKLKLETKNQKLKTNYYVLDMLPYPSGSGMHVGHLKGYVGSDVVARYMRMRGYRVLHPMGWDSFGLPAENYALKVGKHPKELNKELIEKFKSQLDPVGFSYDWTKEINTADPEYIKWTQWFFLLLYKRGLAYRKEAPVNWCPGCQTVLANEQVVKKSFKVSSFEVSKQKKVNLETAKLSEAGNFETSVCERCDTPVIQKPMKQWFFKITAYADRLLDDLENLDWPESTKMGQRNWIGKSEGVSINFKLSVPGQPKGKHSISVFTTRPDTLYGVTFMAIAPELAQKWIDIGWQASEGVKKYIKSSQVKNAFQRKIDDKQKTGVDAEIKAVHPLTKKEIPVFVADYVLMDYGTGALMGVPAHDGRDFEFAKKFGCEIKPVISTLRGDSREEEKFKTELIKDGRDFSSSPHSLSEGRNDKVCEPYTGPGIIINSRDWNGLIVSQDYSKILFDIESRGIGERQIIYKLRDWLISRQRYWGAPIPIVYCDKCGEVPLEFSSLPLVLPDIQDIKPKGISPLATDPGFVNTFCPKCGGNAKRETDTMDGFVDNSWYYFRYLDSHNTGEFCNSEILKYWMPVDLYMGGAEHTVGHLNYSRFFTKVLYDEGLVTFTEPFLKLRHQGIVLAEDSRKMSKRWGNVINPEDVIEQHGADSLRLFEMFMGPFGDSIPWSTKGLVGCRRFLEKVWGLYHRHSEFISESEQVLKQVQDDVNSKLEIQNSKLYRSLHRLIKKVTADLEDFKFNTAIASMMEFVNLWVKEPEGLNVEDQKLLLLVLAPFAPHMAEELWQRIQEPESRSQKLEIKILNQVQDDVVGWSIHLQAWPGYNEDFLVEDMVEFPVQVNGKLRFAMKVQSSKFKVQSYVEEVLFKEEQLRKWVEGKKIRKLIFVPGRLVNIVI